MRSLKAIASCIVIVGIAGAALGQQDRPPPPPGQPGGGQPGRGPGGGQGGGAGRMQQLSPEKAKAAWELQAQSVAASLGLNDEQSKALVKAYSEYRDGLDKARQELMAKAREEGGGGREEMQQKMQEMNTASRAKFEKALASSLSAEQAKKALVPLASPTNRNWDMMVDTIAGFKLDPKKQSEALKSIEEFVVAQGKARESGGGDQDAMREAMQSARQKLNESMKKILNEEQFGKFESSMMGGGGMRGPGGGGRGGDGQGGGRPPRGGGGGGGGGGSGGGGGGGR